MIKSYSVLMSVYANEKAEYLHTSIKSMLDQSIPPTDFVIVCDGPLGPGLEGVIKSYTDQFPELFQVIRLDKNNGLGTALRIGTEKCKNEIIARMDSDDISLRNRMELELEALNKDSSISVIGGQILEFFENEKNILRRRIVPTDSDEIRKFIVKRNPMNHMTVVFRKSDVIAAGSYLSFDKFEDYYLWARMIKMGFRLKNLEQTVVHARVSNDMYRRRGGISYFGKTIRFERYLRSEGFCTWREYCLNVLIRFAGTVIIPNGIRKKIYYSILRK